MIRVLTYNIHGGVGMDEAIDLERLAAVINAAEPDLVALQEVDRFTERSGYVDQAEVLAELTGMDYLFAKALDFDDGEYGNLILSRFSLAKHETHELPAGRETETRSAAEASVKVDDPPVRIRFVSTHIDHASEEERLRQVEFLNELYGQDDSGPMIMAGDFNAEPDMKPMIALGEFWANTSDDDTTPTFPSPDPRVRIDHVLYKPDERFQIVEAMVIDEPVASDHRPVLVVLEFLPEL